MSEEKSLTEVYADRNLLAVGFCELLERHGLATRQPHKFAGCWTPADGEDADADEWAIVYGFLPGGQVSWHVPRALAAESTVPQRNVDWDGHGREQKNERLREFFQPEYD